MYLRSLETFLVLDWSLLGGDERGGGGCIIVCEHEVEEEDREADLRCGLWTVNRKDTEPKKVFILFLGSHCNLVDHNRSCELESTDSVHDSKKPLRLAKSASSSLARASQLIDYKLNSRYDNLFISQPSSNFKVSVILLPCLPLSSTPYPILSNHLQHWTKSKY